MMKEYDLIAIGTGSAMNIVEAIRQSKPEMTMAVVDKDEPGGICLTKACIPTKILLYPAELVQSVERARQFGIDAQVKKVDFEKVMGRMRKMIGEDMAMIKRGLTKSKDIDFYQEVAEFTAPYTLKVGKEAIKGKAILLCTGSRPLIPRVQGLEETGFHTSDTILGIKKRPDSIVIVGGGYIAAEYGHFFASMGSKVTILGRNPQFLKNEEPEVSEVAKRHLARRMEIVTDHEVIRVEKGLRGKKKVIAKDRATGKEVHFSCEEIMVASGRSPNSDLLHPEKAGIEVDERGWIKVDQHLQTSQPGIWAFGDAIGGHLFKHVANYESEVVFRNMVKPGSAVPNYDAVPHAIFTDPEVAGVGMTEGEAIQKLGEDGIMIAFQRFQDTAKGRAMGVEDLFVKGVVDRENGRILGCNIVGPQASVLVQEVIDVMHGQTGDVWQVSKSMHIHPSLSEVVERAFRNLMSVDEYHHVFGHLYGFGGPPPGHVHAAHVHQHSNRQDHQ